MFRVRTKGSFGSVQMIAYKKPDNCTTRNKVVYFTQPLGQTLVGQTKTTFDTVTPNYWRRRARGDIIINAFWSKTTTRVSQGQSNLYQYTINNYCTSPNSPEEYWYTGPMVAYLYRTYVDANFVNNRPLSLQPSWFSNLKVETVTRCLADRQKGLANFVETLAELDKTFGMIRKPLENLSSLVRRTRANGQRAKGYEKVKANSRDFILFTSAEWLRFRYGVSPIISDAKAALKAHKREYDGVREKLSRSISFGADVKSDLLTNYVDYNPHYVTLRTARASQVNCRAVFYDKYVPNRWTDLGLTFHNLVGVSWELTKYSFVVDWFANVGDLMYANIPRVNVTPLGGCLTTRETWSTYITGSSTQTVPTPPNWRSGGGLSDSYLVTDTEVDRGLFGLGDSGFVIKNDFRLDNYIRVTDALTLLSQWLGTIGFQKH